MYSFSSLVELASLIIPLLVTRPSERAAPLRYLGVRLADSSPLGGLPSSAHDGRKCGGRTIGPVLRGQRVFARISEIDPATTPPHPHVYSMAECARDCDLATTGPGDLICTPALSRDRRGVQALVQRAMVNEYRGRRPVCLDRYCPGGAGRLGRRPGPWGRRLRVSCRLPRGRPRHGPGRSRG
jgi:hypothetical protein